MRELLRRETCGRAVVCILLFVCAGCGPSSSVERAAVKGKVLLDGQPLEQGRILFEPTEGNSGPSAGSRITNGVYDIPVEKGAAIGKNVVRINANKPTGKQVPGVMPDQMVEETVEAIPEQFNTKSTLERDVSAGENVLDFELTSK